MRIKYSKTSSSCKMGNEHQRTHCQVHVGYKPGVKAKHEVHAEWEMNIKEQRVKFMQACKVRSYTTRQAHVGMQEGITVRSIILMWNGK